MPNNPLFRFQCPLPSLSPTPAHGSAADAPPHIAEAVGGGRVECPSWSVLLPDAVRNSHIMPTTWGSQQSNSDRKHVFPGNIQ